MDGNTASLLNHGRGKNAIPLLLPNTCHSRGLFLATTPSIASNATPAAEVRTGRRASAETLTFSSRLCTHIPNAFLRSADKSILHKCLAFSPIYLGNITDFSFFFFAIHS